MSRLPGWGSGYNRSAQGGQRPSGAQSSGGRGGWGSGFRGGQGGQQQGRGRGRSDNRFQQLSEQEDNDRAFELHRGGGRGGGGGRGSSSAGRGGRGRGGGRGQVSWRETVQYDEQNERPSWALTCYGHDREGGTDLLGDTSFEELRWQQLQAARAGATSAQIQQQFIAAVRAKEQQWKALVKAQRPPSKGGADIPVPIAFAGASSGQSAGPFQQAAGPFQQAAGPFQQQQQQQPDGGTFGRQQTSPFGTGPQVAFGTGAGLTPATFGTAAQAQPFGGTGGTQSAFGSAPTTSPTFGTGAAAPPFGFTPAPPAFGSGAAPVSPFGAPAAGPAPAFGFGQATAQLQPGGGGVAPLAPQSGASFSAGFGQASSMGQPGPFGQLPGAAASPLQPVSTISPAGTPPVQPEPDAADDSLAVWRLSAFEKGKIPEHPPPPSVCV